jgi:hypothetical protein
MVFEGLTLHELRSEVGPPRVFPRGDNPQNARVVESLKGFNLALKATVVLFGQDEFDRDKTAGPGVSSAIDHAHSSTRQLVEDLVASDRLP